jgi:TM2 domain-containing membrane protein YozV
LTILLILLSLSIESQTLKNAYKPNQNPSINQLENQNNFSKSKKENLESSIKFLDFNLPKKSDNSESELEKIESSINQINNNSSTGVPTSNSTTNASSSVKNKTTIFIFPKCLSDADCSGNGICDLVSSECICNRNFASFYDNSTATISKLEDLNIVYYDYRGQKMCNYERKKQLTAFMLSIFVGFGAEHFYLNRTGVAIAKLVFYFFCGFLNVLYLILYKCVPGGAKYVTFIHTYEALYLGCGVGYMLLWNIFDWVNIGFNDLKDGNNIELSPWGL